jgi:SnoaL-like domain
MTRRMQSTEGITARFRAAAEAGDVDGVMATLAPDVVLHSPITDRVAFHGHAEVRELLDSVFVTILDIRYFADVGDGRTRALFYRARVGSTPLEEATRLELDDAGMIREITLFFRPLPGLATLTSALGPRVAARRHGPLRGLLARLLLAPLGPLLRAGDRLVRWLA